MNVLSSDSSDFIRHLPCDKCGSSDANSLYSDGHCYCHRCGAYTPPEGQEPETKSQPRDKSFLTGEFTALFKRKITEDTCRKFGYQLGNHLGQPVQIAPYYDCNGKLIAQKIRTPDKDFHVRGNAKNMPLFGMNLWDSGKKIVVTEGEIDCMSVSQIQGNRWATVSLPNGAPSARKAIANNLEYLLKFDEIILMFDQDDAGRKAVQDCVSLFPIGRVKVASLPMKDPNECLVAGKAQEVITAIWNAKAWIPDGVIEADSLLDTLDQPFEKGLPWFLPTLTSITYGRRWGEVLGLGAGTGVGKTDFMTQQIAYDITHLKQKVGVLFLEQRPRETLIRIAGKVAGKRFHVPDGGWTTDELKKAATSVSSSLMLFDSFGQTEWDRVKSAIRFMFHEDVRIFYIDHLTALADTSQEKESLEQITKEMAGLANELQIIIHFVSHLATPEGKPHEEGGRVAIRHFKGSRSIGFWSFFLFGMERNQQAEDEEERQTTTFRVLKDRYTGQSTGTTIKLGYDSDTGRLFEREHEGVESLEQIGANYEF